MKKLYILFFILIFCSIHIFSNTKNIMLDDINGHWVSKKYIDSISPIDIFDYRIGTEDSLPLFLDFTTNKYKTIRYETLYIEFNVDKEINGTYWFLGESPYKIDSIKKTDNEIDMYIRLYDNIYFRKIIFISNYEIKITDETGVGSIWYKIDDFNPKKNDKAVCNDNKVRIRTRPDLTSETWGYLYINDYVTIEDKTMELYEINGESWYWYRVDSPKFPDGWVYGKYLDMKDDNFQVPETYFEIPKKMKAQEKTPKSEILKVLYSQGSQIKRSSQNNKENNINTYYDIQKRFYSYLGNIFDEQSRILTIINDKILLPYCLKIGQSESELKEILGEPDLKENDVLVYFYGTKFKYTATFYLKNEYVEEIEVKYEY